MTEEEGNARSLAGKTIACAKLDGEKGTMGWSYVSSIEIELTDGSASQLDT